MTRLRVFNTLSGKAEAFRPLKPGTVKMFVCGPTVQGPTHLGHARTYIFYDVVARYLSHLGFKVEYLMNITDIDERISSAARESRTDPKTLASKYARQFLQDLDSLRVSSVTRFEYVSDRIPEAIRQVSLLIDKAQAYAVGGWVYFDTTTFPRFGRLSHQSAADLALHPLELSPRKKNLADFSLWRPEVLVEGKWSSPWGMGSPGWHIQDTAITLQVFGPQYDIHGGAYELIYPHHEAEVAQGESLTGLTPMVKYWVHTHFVTTGGQKMSKSVGNVFTVRDALKQFSADELRFYLLSTHYRRDMDLSGIRASAHRLGRIRRKVRALRRSPEAREEEVQKVLSPFYSAMNDDFNTPAAIRSLELLVNGRKGNRTVRDEVAAEQAARIGFGILGVKIVG